VGGAMSASRVGVWAAVVAMTFAGLCAEGHAEIRVASINMCADQLLLALADPDQIIGLGPYSRDASLSWMAEQAKRYTQLSGDAEDVLALEPNLVLAGKYGKPATRQVLREQGVAVVEFDAPHSIDDVKKQIQKVGDLVGHPDRAAALIDRIDASAARARAAALHWPARVLAVSRRGWVTGDNSLVSSLLSAVGLVNAANELGMSRGGFTSLEVIVAAHPDLILVAEATPTADDQGKALLLHPVLERLYPPERRLVMSEQFTYCGGPMLPAALDRIADEVAQLRK